MMKLLVLLSAVALAAAANGGFRRDREAEVARINAIPGLTWTAGVSERFEAEPADTFKSLLGVKPENLLHTKVQIALGEIDLTDHVDLGFPADWDAPDAFDSEANWPQCAKVIGDIRDQSACGCCWAFAGAEAASDRLCIATNATVAVPLSAQDVCFCASMSGCDGGMTTEPWNYIKRSGVVTGGQNGKTDDGHTDPFLGDGFCASFSLPHCHHHGPQGKDPYPAENTKGCPTVNRSPKCPSSCDSDAKAPHDSYAADKWTFTGRVQSYMGEKNIQAAVMKHGPIEVAFTVYTDFENYVSGVYKPTTHQAAGGHAVRLVGWGVDQGTKYWKIANSWNPYWGEKGYFRIVRGAPNGGIEDQGAANDGSGTWKPMHGKGPSPSPSPSPPTPSGGCEAKLKSDCGGKSGLGCYGCVLKHMSDASAAGCSSQEIRSFCSSGVEEEAPVELIM